jgi:tetratricopeptide (TPR) repeat protein
LRLAALRFPALALVRRSDAIEVRRSALAVGDVTNAFMAVYRLFDIEVELGNGAAARQCAAEIEALYERQPTPVLRLLHERTVVETLWLDGHVAEAAEQLERSWATAESYGLTRQRQAARTSLSEKIYAALGRGDLAVEAWAPLMRTEYAALSGSGLGPAVALMEAGEMDRAAELYRAAAADRFASVGFSTSEVNLLAFAATLCFQFGTAAEADVLVERLQPFESFVAHTAGSAGSVRYYLGLLELRRGDVEGALARFDAASAQHATLDAPILEAYNQIARAVALGRRGGPGDAEAVAEIVRHIDELVAERGVFGLRHRLDLWLTPSRAATQ